MKMSIRLVVALAALLSLAGVLLATSGSASAQAAVNVPVGDLWFCDSSNQSGVCTTEISVGDTVVWDFAGASLPHTASNCGADCESADGSLWDSGTITDGSSFQFTFSEAGTFLYRCNIHPNQMRGQVVVAGAVQEPLAPTDVPDAADDDADAADAADAEPEVVAAPTTGTGPGPSRAISAWYVAGLAMAGLLLVSGGLVLVGVRRRA